MELFYPLGGVTNKPLKPATIASTVTATAAAFLQQQQSL